jgi:diaminohydroxyphosphoribosylaminopyrimidine deaminase/5-amino-6-(5-phosphoribosylamino)uracil reductase
LATATNKAADIEHMRAALLLAERGLGRTWPNPSVGCVIIDADGQVAGRGHTQVGGRPHAETEALRMAGEAARGATAYVTLEPCAHHGQTPPCADALIAAGIKRCVVALRDPYSDVNGQGIARLQGAGVDVELGLLAEEAADLNLGFLRRITSGGPMVSLKLATSLDGKIATKSGDSKWITGELARALGHRLRASHDAILIGSGTAIADDPELTCRLPGLEGHSPVRIILDRRLRLPLESRLALTASSRRTLLVCRLGHPAAKLDAYRAHGLEVLEVDAGEHGPPQLHAVFPAIGKLGITRVLVEGGATLAAALLKSDWVDKLHWFRAPGVIGGDGLASVAEIGLDRVEHMSRFERTAQFAAGPDTVEIYRKKSS